MFLPIFANFSTMNSTFYATMTNVSIYQFVMDNSLTVHIFHWAIPSSVSRFLILHSRILHRILAQYCAQILSSFGESLQKAQGPETQKIEQIEESLGAQTVVHTISKHCKFASGVLICQ